MKSLILASLVTAGGLMVLPSPASAELITKTYNFDASVFLDSGKEQKPYSNVLGSFTLTFDPAVSIIQSNNIVVNYFSIPFSPSVRFSYSGIGDSIEIGANGSVGQPDIGVGDFYINFTGVKSQSFRSQSFRYTASGYNDGASAGVVAISEVTAVPEPATWAMMILGMGAVGFAMRRRTKDITTTVKFA